MTGQRRRGHSCPNCPGGDMGFIGWSQIAECADCAERYGRPIATAAAESGAER